MNKKMVYAALQNRYKPNEPILLEELNFNNLKYNYLRQLLKRLVDDGKLSRFDAGIYYIPQKTSLLGKVFLDANKVIVKKYIRDDNDVYGYYTGLTFANQIGLTTQVPSIKEIATNREASRGRNVKVKNNMIRLRCSRTTVKKGNYKILQLLDAINECEKWSEYDTAKTYDIIKKYIITSDLQKPAVLDYLRFYPSKVSKKIVESGLLNVLV